MKTGAERAQLSEQIRTPVRAALKGGFKTEEIVFLLTDMLPELTDFATAMGHLSAAFDAHANAAQLRILGRINAHRSRKAV